MSTAHPAEALLETLPDRLRHGLNADQTFAVNADTTTPFSSDEEYVKCVRAVCQLRILNRGLWDDVVNVNLTPSVLKQNGFVGGPEWLGTRLDVLEYKRISAGIQALIKRLRETIDAKLEKSKEANKLPRLYRYAEAAGLDGPGREVLQYLVCLQTGEYRHMGQLDPISVKGVASVLEMGITEMFKFLSSDRAYMKEGLFPYLNSTEINLYDNLMVRTDTLRAFSGVDLSTDEFLRIDGTVLGKVIASEEGSPHRHDDEDVRPSKDKDESDKDEPVLVGKEDLGEEDADKSGTGGGADDHPLSRSNSSMGGTGRQIELHEIIAMEREREAALKAAAEEAKEAGGEDGGEGSALKPWTDNLDYLTDNMEVIVLKSTISEMRENQEVSAERGYKDELSSQLIREKEAKLRAQLRKCERRMALTKAEGKWLPRLERMVQSRGLSVFERDVLIALVASVLVPNRMRSRLYSVRDILNLFFKNMKEQIEHRRFFYKSSTLVREGMINVTSSGFEADAGQSNVQIDRRMLDFLSGLDTEFSELVDGSHLYLPTVQLDDVILPATQKDLVISSVKNFKTFMKTRRAYGLDDVITYGAGLVILLHGKSGTGKTMLANAIASTLEKKILLISFPSLGVMNADENFRFVFREAKIHDALLFFDECESIFESRDMGRNRGVNLLLTEIERHDGLVIMATNRPFDLDEAMHRRITLSIEVPEPDHLSRQQIWRRHLPSQLPLGDDVDVAELARRFELTGGFIKNAVLSALSIAVARQGSNAVVSQEDLLQGAKLQLRGRLQMRDFDRRVVPTQGLDELIVPDDVLGSLRDIVDFEKAHAVLFGQWGFSKDRAAEVQGTGVIFYGPPGCGKSMAAKAIGYECGRPLKVVNSAELVSKYVGESSKNIEAVFREARAVDAVLVFDDAEALFGNRNAEGSSSADRQANLDVGVLLYNIEHYRGICILATNLLECVDAAFLRRMKFLIKFPTPGEKLRALLWRAMVPKEAPISKDVNFQALARDYELAGGEIRQAIVRAAARAALRSEPREIGMADLLRSAAEEYKKRVERGLASGGGASSSLYT